MATLGWYIKVMSWTCGAEHAVKMHRFGSPSLTSPIGLLASLVVLLVGASRVVTGATPLYLLGLYPLSGAWPGGWGQLPATQLGIEEVNSLNILPGYELVIVHNDTECNGGKATDVMYRELYNRSTTKIMVLGAGCSIATQPTAQASHHWNLVQLSYSSSSPLLSNRNLFPKFFRVSPTENVFNVVKFAMLKHFGWKRVAILHQSIDLFSLPTSYFQDKAEENGIEIIAAESFAEHPEVHVSNLKRQDARIIIGNFYENEARNVFCQAYKEGMYGEKIVWIITGWYSRQWWLAEDAEKTHDCTAEQMAEVVDGYFTTDALPLSLSEEPGITGMTTEQFHVKYREYVGRDPTELPGYQEAPYGFDSVWTIALALQKAEQVLQSLDPPQTIGNFSYEDEEMANVIFEAMNSTNFEGVSGPVQFTSDGDRKGFVKVEQNQGGEEVRVGTYNPASAEGQQLQWMTSRPINWKGGKPPADSVQELEHLQSISSNLFIGMATLAVAGIVLALGFLGFNIKYRNKRFIKMSSPKINNLIIIGGFLMYLSILFNGLDASRVPIPMVAWMCKANTWCLGIGFAMSFGAMFTKTWRVHKIFTSKTAKKTIIKDSQLYVMVAVLVAVVALVLIIWEIVDPLQAGTTRGDRVETDDLDAVIIPVYITCESHWQVYWTGSLVCIDGLLLIFGAFLAWETRKVTVPALNDSKYIGMSVYNTVIMSFIVVPVSQILEDNGSRYVIISTFSFFATSLTLCLVFVPKLKVRNDVHPQGAMLSTIQTSDEMETATDREIRTLTETIGKLQAELGKKGNNDKHLDTARCSDHTDNIKSASSTKTTSN